MSLALHDNSTQGRCGKHECESGLENMPLLSLDTANSKVDTTRPAPDTASLVETVIVNIDTEQSHSHSLKRDSSWTLSDVKQGAEPRDVTTQPRQRAEDLAHAHGDLETDEPVSFDDKNTEEVIRSMKHVNIKDNENNTKSETLYWAIVEGNLERVRQLIRDGAEYYNLNSSGNTALHVAVIIGHLHILKYFLDDLNFQNEPNKHGEYPIHHAIRECHLEMVKLLIEKFGDDQLCYKTNFGDTVWHIIASAPQPNELLEEYLLKFEAYGRRFTLNETNINGQSPLNILVISRCETRAARLLRHGAALSVEGENETPVKQIMREFLDPIQFFKNVFDECIYKKNNFVHVDFDILADDSGMNQIRVLEDLANSGQSIILKHPMIESIIFLKWECLRPVYYAILVPYAVFLAGLNIFVITTFHDRDTYNATLCNNIDASDSHRGEGCSWYARTSVAFTYIGICLLFIQECAWIYFLKHRYLLLLESWLKLVVLGLGAAVPALVGCAGAEPEPWQRHVACAALLLACWQAMLLLARYVGWGYYFHMFERVAINILKVLVTPICLVITSAICFMIYYQSRPPFHDFFAAFVKTLVMMSSEFDYGDLFDEDDKAQLVGTRAVVRVLFVAFQILIAIVLMNLMIGVAVSDISELTAIGNIRRLEKQVELLSTVEPLATALQEWFPRLSRLKCHICMWKHAKNSGKKWTIVYRDRNREVSKKESLTKQLRDAIYEIAKKNKQKNVNKDDISISSYIVSSETPHNAISSDTALILERIKSTEVACLEMKQAIDALKNDVNIVRVIMKGVSSAMVKTRLLKRKLKKKHRIIAAINE